MSWIADACGRAVQSTPQTDFSSFWHHEMHDTGCFSPFLDQDSGPKPAIETCKTAMTELFSHYWRHRTVAPEGYIPAVSDESRDSREYDVCDSREYDVCDLVCSTLWSYRWFMMPDDVLAIHGFVERAHLVALRRYGFVPRAELVFLTAWNHSFQWAYPHVALYSRAALHGVEELHALLDYSEAAMLQAFFGLDAEWPSWDTDEPAWSDVSRYAGDDPPASAGVAGADGLFPNISEDDQLEREHLALGFRRFIKLWSEAAQSVTSDEILPIRLPRIW